ncbi:olfactory receptor 49-like [Alosa sapidissima]|uniref:olfactory receptor 49-like n=1 Tax=Alosa sapidissima TaxID=34773 RepID=UPI001C087CA9|nr:olfactory receptor 49-like [Alosa sapidissima]
MQPYIPMMENVSRVSVFKLSGLNFTSEYRYILFSLTLLCYPVILIINITVIYVIVMDKHLYKPMYIFLSNLCINALYGTLGFYPKFLSDLLSEHHVISYLGCLVQVFVIYSSALCEFSTLTVMAVDRYLAICRPLEYHSIMTNNTVIKCMVFSWFSPLLSMLVIVVLSSTLTLCGSNIEKLYCENWSIVKLSCYPTTVNNVFGYIVIIVYFIHSLFIMCSYIKLVRACIKSKEERKRFMQTCMPHLLSLLNVTLALLFDVMFTRYGTRNFSQDLQNFLAMEFLIIPPILNPLIYGLKLTKIRNQLLQIYQKNAIRAVSELDRQI